MRCEEIMKKDVQFVSPRDTVEEAAIRMKDYDVGFLPVCDQSRKVLGTLTDRDLVIRAVARKRKAASTFVEDVMTEDVIACRAEDDVEDAQQAMAEHHKSRIVCCDEDGRLLGVIGLADIAQYAGEGAADTLRGVKEPPEART